MGTIPEQEPYIQPLHRGLYAPFVQGIDMLRLDVIHPIVSGNKWYKLQHYLKDAVKKEADTILTFGGAYSNHLVATAAAARQHGFKSIGIVRGLHGEADLGKTLQDCKALGMQLHFIERAEYSKKYDADYQQSLQVQFSQAYIINEGGAGELGVAGSKTIVDYIPSRYTHVCLSVGTGTTLAGIRLGLPEYIQVHGYVPMKGGSYVRETIDAYMPNTLQKSYTLHDDWHLGGFGKYTEEQIAFMNSFYEANNIPLDMVYTAKMMMGISAQLKAGYFLQDAQILCIHTGGLQGNSSIQHKLIY